MTADGTAAVDAGDRSARDARELVRQQLDAFALGDLADDAQLVASELVTNAILHGGGCSSVRVARCVGGVRIEVGDRRPAPPLLGASNTEGMTGRGIRVVTRVASRWGVEPRDGGKVVWAEVTGMPPAAGAARIDRVGPARGEALDSSHKFHVVLGEVPTDLLIAAKSHVDNLVREFALAASGERSGMSAEVVPHLRALIDTVSHRFSEARESIKRQALAALAAGAEHTRLELDLGADAADAGEDYLEALDSIDAFCRAARLLTLETPPQHRVFRRWYVEELVAQLRAQARGEPAPPPMAFEARLLQEIDRVAAAQWTSERAARLYVVAGALAAAASPESVADAVLGDGVAALDASGGGLLLATDEERLVVPGTVGYEADLVARLRSESADAELPAAVALRTGEAVWVETRAERDRRFPEMAVLEPATVAVCAVPMEVQGRRLGALRFSFNKPRLFDEDERRFVLTLAAQTAQALQRAQLQQEQLDASMRLQRSLLPRSIPSIDGIDVAVAYHPLGSGLEVGGDFYDLWPVGGGGYALAIGDVAGTGPEAAAMTALVRYSLRALTLNRGALDDTLTSLNRLLVVESPGPENEIFCTAIFGLLTRSDSSVTLRLSSGGHPYPFLRRAGGEVSEVPIVGSLLGAIDQIDVGVAELQLGPGDEIVLFTDGVIEARNDGGEMFGPEGVRRVLGATPGTARAVAEALERAVLDHVGGELLDDLALLVMRVGG
jgi:serine phosphatase RsbU (regulator of sigma subunit)/anti-sigma regulatory factor (Ser/Thr protein kinase)